MTVASFVPQVFEQATGKIPTFVSGSTKWLRIVALANTLIQDWSDEKDVDWASLYTPDLNIGTITAAQSFTIPATVRKLSQQQGNVVRILHVDGTTYIDYEMVPADRDKDFASYVRTFQDNYVYQLANKIYFHRAFNSTDPQFGGSLLVPAYTYAPTITADSDVIPIDIPNWLVYATAAAYDSTDVTRQQLVPRLEAKANQIMEVMKANNDGAITDMYRPWQPGSSYSSSTNGFLSQL